ncbi:MAG: UPF0056 inner membrane protein [Porticoccaceae bacterium]|nr:MAG: UPF0056 inner membrane protein [Porticoccaceae bacterium]
MDLLQVTVVLLLVIDPFGNIPAVLAVLGRLDEGRWRRALLRELALAWCLLAAFAVAGEAILAHLGITPPALSVAGGVILFLISLRLIFASGAELFEDGYGDDPLLVPIATPLIAGPTALTTVVVFAGRGQVELPVLLGAVTLAVLACLPVLLAARHLERWLGRRGLMAVEKFTGLVLNLVAVNLMLEGLAAFLGLPPAAG